MEQLLPSDQMNDQTAKREARAAKKAELQAAEMEQLRIASEQVAAKGEAVSFGKLPVRERKRRKHLAKQRDTIEQVKAVQAKWREDIQHAR